MERCTDEPDSPTVSGDIFTPAVIDALLDRVESTQDKLRSGRTGHWAAAYMRMSDENQVYSIANQKAAIREFAKRRELTIVRTYVDEAKSGIVLRSRDALRLLLHDVLSGRARYASVLVYDISRWGRFVDQDEAAFCEFLCKLFGVQVEYCAESFPVGDAIATSLLKSLKRAMASEFSRSLSVSVFEAKARLVRQGFWVNGEAPYGFRRMAVSEDRTHRRLLKPGERKTLKADRDILVPSPPTEIKLVKRIFELASARGMTCRQIAQDLRRRGIPFQENRVWNPATIYKILTNPVYIGTNAWNRTSCKLQGPRRRESRDRWLEVSNAFSPIVTRAQFDQCQRCLKARWRRDIWTKESALLALTKLFAKHKVLSAALIDSTAGVPSSGTLSRLFGSIDNAYKRVGFTLPTGQIQRREALLQSLRLRKELTRQILHSCPQETKEYESGHGPVILLNRRLLLSISILRAISTPTGLCWHAIPRKQHRGVDLRLLALLDGSNQTPLCLYVLPVHHLIHFRVIREGDNVLNQGVRIDRLKDIVSEALKLM